eukprot:362534-Chlamydomonas_euryale.AAC.5
MWGLGFIGFLRSCDVLPCMDPPPPLPGRCPASRSLNGSSMNLPAAPLAASATWPAALAAAWLALPAACTAPANNESWPCGCELALCGTAWCWPEGGADTGAECMCTNGVCTCSAGAFDRGCGCGCAICAPAAVLATCPAGAAVTDGTAASLGSSKDTHPFRSAMAA